MRASGTCSQTGSNGNFEQEAAAILTVVVSPKFAPFPLILSPSILLDLCVFSFANRSPLSR